MEKLLLISSDAYKNAPHYDIKKKICNGVGPAGFWGKFIPETIWFLNVSEAANIHDWDYEVGITEEDRIIADSRFLRNLLKIIEIKTKWKWLKKLRITRARFYFLAVSFLGEKHFGNKRKFKPIESEIACLLY